MLFDLPAVEDAVAHLHTCDLNVTEWPCALGRINLEGGYSRMAACQLCANHTRPRQREGKVATNKFMAGQCILFPGPICLLPCPHDIARCPSGKQTFSVISGMPSSSSCDKRPICCSSVTPKGSQTHGFTDALRNPSWTCEAESIQRCLPKTGVSVPH